MAANRTSPFPLARAPLPAPVAWRIAELAVPTTGSSWRTRFAAVVLVVVLARRTSEVLELQLQDVEDVPGGGLRCSVFQFKSGERRNNVTRLVFGLPPSRSPSVPDLSSLFVSYLVASLRAAGAPPPPAPFRGGARPRSRAGGPNRVDPRGFGPPRGGGAGGHRLLVLLVPRGRRHRHGRLRPGAARHFPAA
eukprot:TRINITY_DN5117_c0_g1_i2.p2 TRINITY_DN5117_c0_g1~~TRINITY_DN5117_c0_g1_i2.p2  ORF type:complete len:192 (+),score=12.70 TRINITY_DN5117_c0_g1_i2:2258-2833(+)